MNHEINAAERNGRATNKLSDRKIKSWLSKARASKLKAKLPKLSDGGGLYLTVTKAGTAIWRIKYRIAGKESTYTVGNYPEIQLQQARAERDSLRGQLRDGKDPVTVRRVNKAAAAVASENSFEAVTSKWLTLRREKWSEVHYKKSRRALERDVLPIVGNLPVTEVTSEMVAGIVESVMRRGARDTAAKILWHISGVFRLAQARGLCNQNPADPVSEILSTPCARPMPAKVEFPELGAILRLAAGKNLSPDIYLAHRLCAFTVARIGNVMEARWPEFNLDARPATWIIPRPQMKAQNRLHDHKIILSDSIVGELRDWLRKRGRAEGYLFPSRNIGKHVTREAVEKCYREKLDLRNAHTPHSWRSAFSTLARDHGFERDVVELTLDHIHDNAVARAYDRGERLSQRIKLMTWWSDQLAAAQRGELDANSQSAAA